MTKANIIKTTDGEFNRNYENHNDNDAIVTNANNNIIITTAEQRLMVNNLNDSNNLKASTIKTTRNKLWYMILTGFIVDAMIRTITSIAIIDMVVPKGILLNNSTNTTTPRYRFSFERLILDKLGFEYNRNGFEWNEYEQGLVIGSFYWFHWMTQIPGGILARKYGTKRVFGLINLIGSIVSILEPMCAFISYRLLMAFRIVQGTIYGMGWPSMHCLVSHWVPPNERSKFISAYSGHAVGIAFAVTFFGFIISISSWEWTYYIGGVIGIIWWICWHFMVYDTPEQHPSIHPLERQYIEQSLGDTVQKEIPLKDIPWKSIITSRPLWIIAICQWGAIWSFALNGQQGPAYFKRIHNFNIRSSGLISGLPFILKMLFSYYFSIFADYLLRTKRMSRTNVRKMGGAVSTLGQGLSMLGLSMSGYNSNIAILFFSSSIVCHGAGSVGQMANEIDISPNYASIMLGMTLAIGSTTGYLTPLLVGSLTLNNQTPEQWQLVYRIAASITICCGIVYILFADASLQKWNTPKNKRSTRNNKENNKYNHELVALKSSKDSKVTIR